VGLTGAALTLRSHVPLCLFVGLAYNFACFKAFSSNLAMDMVAPTVTLVLAFAASSTLNYFIEIKKKRWIEGAFSQFLSPVVLEQLKKNPAALKPGGERREMTVLFSDLAGFTTMSEMLAPEALVSLLNEYLTAMADEIVVDHGGYVDKYIGGERRWTIRSTRRRPASPRWQTSRNSRSSTSPSPSGNSRSSACASASTAAPWWSA
jgi:hypothetical protein